MRKKYDEIRTNTNHLDAEVEKNRKALDLLKAEEQRLSDHNSATKLVII